MTKRWLVAVVVIGIGVAAGCASSGGDDPGSATTSDRGGTEAPPPTGAETPEEKPLVNTLKWTTASEVDNFGFDIYRGVSEEGPFERITSDPLPGAGTTDEPQKYVYLDEEIDPGRDYYYYIESISLGGIRERFSPIIKAPAKQP